MRMLGVILIAAGLMLFLGNFSGLFRLMPGIGIVTVLVGGFVFALADRFDVIPPGNEE